MSIDDTLQDDFFLSALSEDDFDTLSNESHHGSSSIPQSPDFFGLPSDLMEDWSSSFPDLDMLLDATGSEFQSFDSNGLDAGVIPDVTVPRPDASLELQPQLWRDDPVMEEFFLKNGASRPPAPCDHCRRRKLQCFLIQTTPSNPNPTTACSTENAAWLATLSVSRSLMKPRDQSSITSTVSTRKAPRLRLMNALQDRGTCQDLGQR